MTEEERSYELGNKIDWFKTYLHANNKIYTQEDMDKALTAQHERTKATCIEAVESRFDDFRWDKTDIVEAIKALEVE